MNYCLPEIPKVYWIKKIVYRCKSCGYEFEYLVPNSDDIVKYKEKGGTEIKWLPTYGKGGYLDLMCKLVPSHKLNNPITMKIAKEFNSKLGNFIETSSNGKEFTLDDNLNLCDRCHSKELQYIGECILISPEISWLKLSCDLLK